MGEPQRRRRWQMHLSTAVWMMVAAGGIIWRNTRSSVWVFVPEVKDNITFKQNYGWPVSAMERYWLRDGGQPELHHDFQELVPKVFSPSGITINFAVALAILFAVWYVSEWWIK